jgi:hypothetical protein
MATTDQTLDDCKTRLEDKDPVLALLSEISASLKDLNLTFKNHAERLAKLEEQKPGHESGPQDDVISEQREGDDGSIRTQSAHQDPEASRSLESLIPKLELKKPRIPQGTVDGFIEVKYGTFPPVEAYDQYQFIPTSEKPQLLGDQDYLSWLKEKRLVFPDDGRCYFPFDIVHLARSPDLNAAHRKIDQMEEFCRDLRKRGGFFFVRDSDMQGGNKIWNGSDIFTLPDNHPVPFPGIDGIDTGSELHFSGPSTFYKTTGARWEMKAPFRRLW